MASQGTFLTPEGIVRKYPMHYVLNSNAGSGKLSTMGAVEQMEINILMKDLPNGTPNYNVDRTNAGTLNGYSPNDGIIPANSSITGITIYVEEAAAGGTSFNVGSFLQDGTAVDADGFAATVLLASVNAVGKRVVGAGALTTAATASVGTSDVAVGVTATGVFTAGKIRIVVDYVLNVT